MSETTAPYRPATPAQHDGASTAGRALNSQLRQLIGARYTPLPDQQGLAVLDRRGRRVATLYWEPAPLVPELGQDQGDQHPDDDQHHQEDQAPEQEPGRVHAVGVFHSGRVAQTAGQEAPEMSLPLPTTTRALGQQEDKGGQTHSSQHHQRDQHPVQERVHSAGLMHTAGQESGA